ncbi:MAG: Mur ligase family protein [Pseudomonadota bacterium]
MEFLDARRLTGPSIIADGPGSILDVRCTPDESEPFVRAWKANVLNMHEVLGWPKPVCVARRLLSGVSVAFSSPIDRLYAASELNEWAYAVSAAELGVDVEVPDFDETVAALLASAAEEANPELIALVEAAARREKPLLWDDDHVSIGLGRSAKTWGARDLLEDVDWDAHDSIPIGLVTGTNGKTTTVRLATHIVRAAGLNVGLSSTDWIAVNDRIIDRGDWSGPGGARAVLRESDVDVAILESARGGLLRRGLGVDKADAALITNIAEDHLGDFGSQDLNELLNIKWVTSRAVRRSGTLILNADDALLVGKAPEHRGEIEWFSLDASNAVVVAAIANGGRAFVLDDGVLKVITGDSTTDICRADEIPITLGGAAQHNVANALAAAALTFNLGIALDSIRAGLCSMSQDDNPGRCNIYDVAGVKVLVDFAHNPAAMHALFDMAQAIPASRRVLCFGQAGDRPDDLIRNMTRDAFNIGLDQVMVSELAAYHRGREHGEIFNVIRDELVRCGLNEACIGHYEEEMEAFDAALAWAQPGDLVIMLALGGAAPIQDRLRALGAE